MQLHRTILGGFLSAALAIICLSGATKNVEAGIIPYSVIAPHEYQLPVGNDIPKDGINLLLSYNTYRDENKAWSGESGARSTFISVNKFAHIFKIDGLNDVGFLWEAVTGFASATGKDNNSVTGLIDGQTGLVAWIKPTKNWVNCLEYWLYLPIGDNELSSHSWNHSFAYMTNYVLGNFTFDGDLGVKIMGDSKHNGTHAEQGDVFFANTVFTYKFMKQVEPFLKFDYQSSGQGKIKSASDTSLNPGDITSSQSELTYGIGNQFQISDKLSFAAWYAHGITGRNTTKTNAGYIRAIWTF